MKKVISSVFLVFIKVYQRILSPLFASACRFTPTCSQYGIEAIRKYGPFKGGFLLVKRIGTCHPWGKHGYDPVP